MNYTRLIERYSSTLYITMRYTLKYRMELVTNLLKTLISPFAVIILWSSAYIATGVTSINGFSNSILFSYFIISSAVAGTAISSTLANRIQNDVQTGYISVHLIKPVNYIWYRIMDNLGVFFLDMMVTLLPILLLVMVFFHPSITLLAFIEFIIELILISIMTGMIFIMVGTLSVYLVSIGGITNIILWTFNVLGGRLIPLNVMPDGIKTLLEKTPIYLIYYLPSATFTGLVNQQFILNGILNLVIWIGVFGFCAFIVWSASKKRLFAAGG